MCKCSGKPYSCTSPRFPVSSAERLGQRLHLSWSPCIINLHALSVHLSPARHVDSTGQNAPLADIRPDDAPRRLVCFQCTRYYYCTGPRNVCRRHVTEMLESSPFARSLASSVQGTGSARCPHRVTLAAPQQRMWALSPVSGCIPKAAADAHAGRGGCRLAPVGQLSRGDRSRRAALSTKLSWRSGEAQTGCALLQRAPAKRHRPVTAVRRLDLPGRACLRTTDA